MVRRTSPRSVADEATFPIRVALRAIDEREWLRWRDAEVWLRENVGPGEYANHGLTKHRPYAMGFYFRSIDAAQQFLEAFPEMALADGTESVEHLRQARRPSVDGVSAFDVAYGSPMGT